MILNAIDPRGIRIGRKPFLDFRETQIFYLGYGRNAWNGIWINRYDADQLAFEPEPLKDAAEAQRMRGTVFKIVSLPLIVIRSARGSFGICEINQKSPYEYNRLLEEINYDGPHKLFEVLPAPSADWLLVVKLNWKRVPNTPYSNYLIRSFRSGPYRRLGWKQFKSKRNLLFLDFAGRLLNVLREHSVASRD